MLVSPVKCGKGFKKIINPVRKKTREFKLKPCLKHEVSPLSAVNLVKVTIYDPA